ncbi:Peptidase S10, serine carboxypeptidase [Corchorus capsularis]|uniref:Peptidase S10, serine carboxypeptidase n=1 Tax=Corchorus capsularis TaxID=210143 RepID=A0A1R3G3G3_COCAP|nr:Peptidase S10, serine carboxypeptidase [Corchorus capsularis]
MALDKILEQLARMFPKLGCFFMAILLVWSTPAVPFSTITSLPGFPNSLPKFKLETGYIGVGDAELFYYFIESESNPAEDPLLLWLTGGPGCTSLAGLVFEIGPVRLNMVEYNGSLPTFEPNPYSWTKVANIIFLDAPVGTGFSYSRTLQGLKTGDQKSATDSYNFLRKWLLSHPKFIRNPLYIAGDSYSGKIVPMITRAISDGIEDGSASFMNLKGYLVGNPFTDPKFDEDNSRIPFYNRMALISDELYESAKSNCKDFWEVDSSNEMCAKDLETIKECTAHINRAMILEADCLNTNVKLANSSDNNRKIFLERHEGHRLGIDLGCRTFQYDLCTIWANDISVQKALGIRMGTIKEWLGCGDLDYDRDVESAVGYHEYLNRKGYRALIYSGDHDAVVTYVGTIAWIRSLNLSVVDSWRPWMVDDQVGGYSTEFENDFTFTTIKARVPLIVSDSFIYKKESFGDSISDTGNLLGLQLSGSINSTHVDFLPYGTTFFHHPTGRASDGRLVVDFITEALGLPFVRPFFGRKNGGSQNFHKGVNFAIIGATAIDYAFHKEISDIDAGPTNISLGAELEYFKKVLPSLCSSDSVSSIVSVTKGATRF